MSSSHLLGSARLFLKLPRLSARWSPPTTWGIAGDLSLQDDNSAALALPLEAPPMPGDSVGAPDDDRGAEAQPGRAPYALRKKALVDKWSGLCSLALRGSVKSLLGVTTMTLSDAIFFVDPNAADGAPDIIDVFVPISRFYATYKLAPCELLEGGPFIEVFPSCTMPTTVSVFSTYFSGFSGGYTGDASLPHLYHGKVKWNMASGIFCRGTLVGERTFLFKLCDVSMKSNKLRAEIDSFVKAGAKAAARSIGRVGLMSP